MIRMDRSQLEQLRSRFLPDRPGPLVGLHAIHTGLGEAWVDRWPDPRVIAVVCGDNWSLSGDPAALGLEDLASVSGLIDAPPEFVPVLRSAHPDLLVWDRIIYALPGDPKYARPDSAEVRRIETHDAKLLAGLSDEVDWIHVTSGGPIELARSGLAWGAFVKERLASLAAPFLIGEHYEDIAVVTESEHRGLGLNPACAGKVCEDIRSRGRTPSWTTSADNVPSRRVAEKLGFELVREDVLYVIGQAIPAPAPAG